MQSYMSFDRRTVQGYLAHKKLTPPKDHHRTRAWSYCRILGGGRFLMSEAPLYGMGLAQGPRIKNFSDIGFRCLVGVDWISQLVPLSEILLVIPDWTWGSLFLVPVPLSCDADYTKHRLGG